MVKRILFCAALTVSALALTACGTVVDRSSQQTTFEAIGATDVECKVFTKDFSYVVHPPQTITLKKTERDLNVHCFASGNREKKLLVEATLSPWTFGNIVDGVVPGGVYDFYSGGMFRYPQTVVVDFTDTVATVSSLPVYEAPDAIDPRIVGLEDVGPKSFAIPEDETRELRGKMAQIKADQDAALDAEREARKIGIEGGWDAGKTTGKDSD